MRIVRVAARQGHAVPASVTPARGPFPPELFQKPQVVADYEPQPDGGGDPVPDDGTAQNGFRSTKWYRCRDCHSAVAENDLDSHDCEGL